MPELPESSKLSATPGKLALIGVLAVVLVVVLAVQFGGVLGAKPSADGDPGPEGPKPAPSWQLSEQSARPCRELAGGQDAPRPWPQLELADVSAYDPFALRTSVAKPAEPPVTTGQRERDRAQQEQLLEQLREKGVQAVIGGSRRGNAAVIGSEIVRVGDALGEFRVVGIGADGVVLERPAEE